VTTPEVIKACPFYTAWPTLHFLRCEHPGCPCGIEFWMAREGALSDIGTRATLVNRVLAGAGWLCLIGRPPGGGASSTWLCPACAREMVDPYEAKVVEAQESRAHMSRIELSAERGAWSQPAR
jgi:hypothetical protein